MASRQTPPGPTPTKTADVLERIYDIKAATVRLGIATPDPKDEDGQRWLRDGFNRPTDGSKGRKFPGQYMSGKLTFTESQLAEILQISYEETIAKQQAKPKPSTGRPRRVRAVKTPALATV
jgi:hypothetical protein